MAVKKSGVVLSSDRKEKIYKRMKASENKEVQGPPVISPLPTDIQALVDVQLGSTFSEVFAASEDTVQISFQGKRPLPKLPAGYFLKGSAPRELLRSTFFPEQPVLEVRDIDIVRFRDTPDVEDHRLSLQYMPDDYQFGRGVEVVEDRRTYFLSRDLSVNEVLFSDRTLEFSHRALRDLRDGVIRATSHITQANGEVDTRIAAKSLRLQAEASVKNKPLTLEGFPERLQSTPFDIALHLDRALAVDIAVAEEYLLLVWKHKLLLEHREVPPSVVDAVLELQEFLKAGADFFKHLSPEHLIELMRRLSR